MANENDEDIDSQNDGSADQDTDKNLATDQDQDSGQGDDLDALKEKNRQLFARAKKAEGCVLKDGKWIKKEKPVVEKKPDTNSTTAESLTREEVVLIAKGTDEEDLTQLKFIQKGMGEGATLKQASESPLYQGYVANKAAEDRKRKGALGASNGGHASEAEEKLSKPNLSEAEHKAIWEKEHSK